MKIIYHHIIIMTAIEELRTILKDAGIELTEGEARRLLIKYDNDIFTTILKICNFDESGQLKFDKFKESLNKELLSWEDLF